MEKDGQTISEWITVLDFWEAREMNSALVVSTFPKMKKKEQEKITQGLQRRMNPQAEKKAVTTADLAKIIAGGANGRR